MQEWSAKRGVWWFAAASAALHLGWYALLREPPKRQTESAPDLIELTFDSPRVAEPPALEAPPQAASRVQEPEPPSRRRLRSVRAEALPPAPSAEALPAPTAKSMPAAPQVTLPATAAPSPPGWPSPPNAVDLSPRRAASTMVDQVEIARVCKVDGGAASAAACEPPVDGVVEGKRALDSLLRQAASAPAYRARREPPELHREGDGAYRFDGHVFTARIRTDGHVEFMDAPPASVDGLATGFPGVKGGLDLTDAIEHGILGKERYSAEKRWFLEQTTELREQLTAAARVREAASARAALEGALQRILAAGDLSPDQKRGRVLELWEDCGEDGESHPRRRTIEAFVRTHMPEGGALGFSRAELERFNRGRRGLAAFDPYRWG